MKMEANGKKKRLEEAKKSNEFLKLIFQYPNSHHATVKRGYVIECYDDSFWFDERFDGKTTFGYDYLVEIVGARS